MLKVDSITKKYGHFTALNRVSFEVPEGQVLGLLGENGAGKTTALNIITGCLAPSSGSVTVSGYDLILNHREAKRLIGYLPETAPLYDEMSVKSFLMFMCALREVEKADIEEHIHEICDMTGLTTLTERRIGNLSKGLRQRVALASALCGSPSLIILDEPTVGLDPSQIIEFRQLIRNISGEHTVIFSTHILSEVQELCDRAVILHHGEIIADHMLSDDSLKKTSLELVAGCAPSLLLPQISKLKSVLEMRVINKNDSAKTHVMLTVSPDEKPERELFDLLVSLNAPVLKLLPLSDTLEDIFLKATGSAK